MEPTFLRLTVERPARVLVLGNPAAPEVWVALHGYGQLAATFAPSFVPLAGPARCVILPEAPARFYLDAAHQRVGASWMAREYLTPEAHAAEARRAEVASLCAYLDATVAHVAPGRPVSVLGFSQGAHVAARWAALGQTPAQRLVLWGVPFPDDLDPSAHRERLAGFTLVAGDADPLVTPARLDPSLARLDAAGLPYRLERYAGAHVLDPAVLARVLSATGA